MSTPTPNGPTPLFLPPITLSRALPQDCYEIAALEAHTFYNEPFSALAFGPRRDSPENLSRRAKILASKPKDKGKWNRVVKAVVNVDGKEEIVGAAGWSFVTGRKGEGEEGKEGKEPIDWGEGANVRFCEDMFLVADGHMLRSTEGRDYAKLSTLVVSPKWQRRGIGTVLMENGLKEADELGLQTVLGASKKGKGLYKKYGFVEFEVMDVRLREYEGGEGMGKDQQVIMNRLAHPKA